MSSRNVSVFVRLALWRLWGRDKMRQYWNVLTYCTRPSCVNEARYCYNENDLVRFICKECRKEEEL